MLFRSQEMSEFFTFFVPGHKFTPAFKNKIWDGKIRLLDLRTGEIYLGLLPYIQEFADSRDYTLETNGIGTESEFSVYHAKKFVDSLNLHSAGKKIEIREHQLDALIHAMQSHRALMLSPTASGKSLIIYTIIRQLIDYQGLRGLIIVPTTSLVEQLYSDFADYSEMNGFDVEANVHRVYQGRDKLSDKNVILSTWQSIYQLPDEYFEKFDFVIGDEAHNFKAQSLTSILTNCVNAKYRIGMTGTLDGTKTHKLVLEGLFGKARQFITTKELIDKGVVSRSEEHTSELQSH